MQRTIRLQLHPSPDQAQRLAETARQFTAVFNAVCALGWRDRLSNGVKLHHATYYPLKADFPDLVSDLHIQARVKATEALKSAYALRKAGRTVRQPSSRACPPRYNRHTFRLDWDCHTVRRPCLCPKHATWHRSCLGVVVVSSSSLAHLGAHACR